MSAVAVLPVDRLIDRLGHLELQQKHLGLINHAYGVRLAIAAIQAEDAGAWLVEPPPAASVMGALAASLGAPADPP